MRVVYDPARVSYEELLRHFWESHDPTQGMRQGNDAGTSNGKVDCGGQCVRLIDDPNNCGACGNPWIFRELAASGEHPDAEAVYQGRGYFGRGGIGKAGTAPLACIAV